MMDINISESLFLFLPEIVMVLGAMSVLMLGAFGWLRFAPVFAIAITSIVAFLTISTNHVDAKSFGGMMHLNAFINYGKALITIASTFILLLMFHEKRKFELPVLVMLSTAGMMLLVSANSLLTLYISLELMSLPSYIMAAFDRERSRSTEAGMKYFILGSIASGLFLLGTSFVYGFTGAINFDGIYDYYVTISSDAESTAMPIGFLIGLVFIIVAMSFKISAAPFHMWAPDVYQGSPTIVTTFFASAPKIAGFMILIKLLLDPFSQLYVQWQQIVLVISIASMFVGSLGAIMQRNFKRLLAYSSIGHVGFMLSGVVTAENEGVQGVLIYMAIYLTMTLATFACLLLLKKDKKLIEDIYDLAGLAKSHPSVALGLAALMLSMAGIPPMAGFFAKFYILIPLIKTEMYSLAVTFVIASVISAFYYLKIIKIVYFDAQNKKLELTASPVIKATMLLGVAFNVLYIFAPAALINAAEVASLVLFK
ncbi:MAG: NADH-quinone oxidoreductase subunit NuoN [Candidatus Jidaibacter sp.]|jgi:NADH-quinone oxidoreductase subunit N|nr:NADH-quinone oxidoreductase subunit NuoN [Candidatus Jidaibacter sp.]